MCIVTIKEAEKMHDQRANVDKYEVYGDHYYNEELDEGYEFSGHIGVRGNQLVSNLPALRSNVGACAQM